VFKYLKDYRWADMSQILANDRAVQRRSDASMAGLTSCAFAARAGYRVVLCDKDAVLGGLVNSFERNDFTWDAGIRAIEDSGIIFPMLMSPGIS
jgi:hypothetical protein